MTELFLAGAQLVISIVAAGLTAYLAVWLFDKTTPGVDEWNELRRGNTAVGVVLAAVVLAVGLIMRAGFTPAALNLDLDPTNAVITRLFVQLIQIVVSLLLAVVSITVSVWVFTRLTGAINEWAEINRGNTAIALMLAAVIVTTALITSTGLDAVLKLITGG